MKIKIFSCHHASPQDVLATDIYQTFTSGAPFISETRIMTDIAGVNISHAQKFSELRHQYYVWRNAAGLYDYVGFEHYRRPFYIDPLPFSEVANKYPLVAQARLVFAAERDRTQYEVDAETLAQFHEMRSAYGENEHRAIKRYISSCDMMITYPIHQNIDENFRQYHHGVDELWQEFLSEIERTWNYHFETNHVQFPPAWSGFLNMYIMRWDLFVEYMDIILPVLLRLERKYPQAPGRIWGFMSERVLGAYVIQKSVEQPGLRVQVLPHLFGVR